MFSYFHVKLTIVKEPVTRKELFKLNKNLNSDEEVAPDVIFISENSFNRRSLHAAKHSVSL